MRKSKRKIAKSGHVVTRKSHPVLKPQVSARSKRAVHKFDALPKSQKHVQVIVHNGKARGHTDLFDTGAQQSMIGRYGWEIIKRYDTWIHSKGVNLDGSPNAGLRLHLLDARGVVKTRWYWKSYLVILGQAFFNPDLDKTLLAEDQIECNGVKVFSRPRVFGGKQLVEARD